MDDIEVLSLVSMGEVKIKSMQAIHACWLVFLEWTKVVNTESVPTDTSRFVPFSWQNWYLNPLVLLRFKSQLSGGPYQRQGQDIDFDNTGMDRRMRILVVDFGVPFMGT